MKVKSKILPRLLTVFLVVLLGVIAFRYAHAQDASQPKPDPLTGTYLVTIDTGRERSTAKAIVNPRVITIAEKHFLHGAEAGAVKDIIKETPFSGQMAYIPLDRIVAIQKLDTR